MPASSPRSVITSVSSLKATVTEPGSRAVACCPKALAAWASCYALLESDLSMQVRPPRLAVTPRRAKPKKADVAKRPKVFKHVGLLFNEPPGAPGLPFIKSSVNSDRTRRIVRRGSTCCQIVRHGLAKGSQIPGSG